VANRRVAWEPQAVWAWTKAKAAAMGALMRPRRAETEQTLGALKHRREQTQQQYQPQTSSAASSAQAQSASSSAEGDGDPTAPESPSRKQRFDVGKQARPSADFTQAVGGASDQPDGQGAPQSATASDEAPDQTAEPETTSSRLRAAKQRSRQRMQSDDDE
jgi:hypothetical protein